jgi:Ca2+-binding EF-hand superfamily protein
MSRNINIYTSPTEKIPKIYILAACRVGDESISFNTLQKCLTDLEEEQRRESGFKELSSFTRTKSASQIEIFKTFKKIYDDVSSLITSGNLDNINRFIPADIAKTPETQKSIHQILQSALGDISYHIQNGLVTPKYFCMLKNLLEHNFSYEYKKLYLDLLIKLRKP